MIAEVLILKKKIPKVRKFFQRFKASYWDMLLIFLTLGLFMILIFSFLGQPRGWTKGFPDECQTYGSSCARLAYSNQYRTNRIQNQFPLTFRNVTDVDVMIDEYLQERYEGWIVKYEVDSEVEYPYLIYSISNAIGIMNDVAIKIDSCKDVWSTTSISIQSQLRLGLKDYGSNYEIVENIIKFLQQNIDPNKQNWLFCKSKFD